MNHNNITIAIHGGAGTILRTDMTPELEQQYEQGLRNALNSGFAVLAGGGSSTDAVEVAVAALEDCILFNAGKGAVFNNKGRHEMDSAIMFGKTLAAGAVCSVSNIRNPVMLARAVMEHSGNVLLTGAGAEEFARLQQIQFGDDTYFFSPQRYEQWQEALKADVVQLDHAPKKFGTVGAVALDKEGNLSAATSTGGLTNKKFGRVGDSPIIGAGTYANNSTCAVSCTGVGELFMRCVVAYDISCLLEYKGLTLKQACDLVVYDKLVKIGGEGGLIALDKEGNIEMPFNSEGMYRACRNSQGRNEVLIYRQEV